MHQADAPELTLNAPLLAGPVSLDALRERLELRLAAVLPLPDGPDDLVAAAMREAVVTPGKRLRPMLLLAATAALGGDPQDTLDAACALELVHAASLVLDDLPCMDDADLRRGQPTVHLQFGDDVAVLASVALLSLAFRLVATSEALPADVRGHMVATLADAAGHAGLVGGQLRDLRAGSTTPMTAEAVRVNQLKTGSLFRAAFEMAALASGTSPATRQRLQHCADEIGQAFQLLDDLKDRGLVPSSGKSLHQDDGKPTLLALLGAEAARERVQRHLAVTAALVDEVFSGGTPVREVLWGVMPPLALVVRAA